MLSLSKHPRFPNCLLEGTLGVFQTVFKGGTITP